MALPWAQKTRWTKSPNFSKRKEMFSKHLWRPGLNIGDNRITASPLNEILKETSFPSNQNAKEMSKIWKKNIQNSSLCIPLVPEGHLVGGGFSIWPELIQLGGGSPSRLIGPTLLNETNHTVSLAPLEIPHIISKFNAFIITQWISEQGSYRRTIRNISFFLLFKIFFLPYHSGFYRKTYLFANCKYIILLET